MSKYIGELLINKVRELAAQRPDFIYERPQYDRPLALAGESGPCQYVYQGKPSCLVGWAAMELGLIDASIEDEDTNLSGVLDLSRDMGWAIPSDYLDWLAVAQGAQDDGETWGEAVALADAEFPVPSLV